MTDRVVTVAVGSVRWGYHSAAVLSDCTVTRTDGVWSLVGIIEQADTYRLSQQPLVFAVKVQSGQWTWPIIQLQIEGASLRAVLGPKE